MNLRLSALYAALGCVFLASCTPFDESQNKKPTQKPAPKTVTSPEQQKIQQQRDALKDKQKPKTPEDTTTTTAPPGNSTQPAPTPNPPAPPAPEKRPEYKFANKVPGKDGFVFSPYNNKVIDVRGMPPGTLVQDPTFSGEGKGYFRVP